MTLYLKDDFNYDADLVVEDSLDSSESVQAITTSQVGKLLDVAQIIDLGDGLVDGYMVIDIDGIEVGTDEDYTIKIQGTQSSTFGSSDIIDLAALKLGHADALVGNAAAGAAGDRFVLPFRNEQNGEVYRYVRAYTYMDAGGTGETITYTGWLAIKRKQ